MKNSSVVIQQRLRTVHEMQDCIAAIRIGLDEKMSAVDALGLVDDLLSLAARAVNAEYQSRVGGPDRRNVLETRLEFLNQVSLHADAADTKIPGWGELRLERLISERDEIRKELPAVIAEEEESAKRVIEF